QKSNPKSASNSNNLLMSRELLRSVLITEKMVLLSDSSSKSAISSVDHSDSLDSGPDLDVDIQSTGILLCGMNGCGILGTTATSVSQNQVFDNDIGVAFFTVEGTSVTQNSITNNRYGNVVLFSSNNNFIGSNTVSISNPSAKGATCTVPTCTPYSYTLGIDVLDSSAGNTIFGNTVSVTADLYAVLLD